MRKLALVIAAWMVLVVGLAVAFSQRGGDEKTTQAQPTATGQAPGPTTSTPDLPSGQDPDPEPGSIPEGLSGTTPVTPAPGADETPLGLSAEDQEKLELATSGWPAVAKLPWQGKQVAVDYGGVAEGLVVLNVVYSGSEESARNEVGLFLTGNGDTIGHYRLRLLSPDDIAAEEKVALAFNLSLKGYIAVPYLPLTKGKTTLVFVGQEGKDVILEASYRGTRAQAEQDVVAILKELADKPGKYTILYRKR